MKEYIFSDRVMGTELDVVALGDSYPTKEEKDIRNLFSSYEKKFSRFIENSELSRLNRDKKLNVSDDFIKVLLIAKDLYKYTDGIFNPLISPYFLGYRSDFDNLNSANIKQESFGNINFDQIIIDADNNYVELKDNQYLDFGGFLKGHTSDLASKMMTNFKGSIVNLGGDIVCRGMDIGNVPFIFQVAHPIDNEGNIASIELNNESLATSSIVKRNWSLNGKKYHHIVDPRNKNSADNTLLSVSVVHKTGAYADALATLAIVLGLKEGLSFFEKNGIKAMFITNDLKIISTSNIQNSLSIAL